MPELGQEDRWIVKMIIERETGRKAVVPKLAPLPKQVKKKSDPKLHPWRA